MKAIVTGITGFAGSHLAEHLLASGDEVLGVARRAVWPADLTAELGAKTDRLPIVSWDVAEPLSPAVRERMEEFAPDCLYHLAAISVPDDCGVDAPTALAIATNVDGVRRVVELAATLRSRPQVLLASSSYVYAIDPDRPLVNESSPISPLRAYGQTKLAAESEFLSGVKAGRITGMIARAFQHTGPRQSPRMLLPEWARQIVVPGDEPIRVQRLDAYLDLSDVRDVVRAYRLLMLHGKAGAAYNVGSGICRRSGDIFDTLRRLYDPRRPVVETSPGKRQHPIADLTRITADTGWRPEIPFERTLTDTVEYWRRRAS